MAAPAFDSRLTVPLALAIQTWPAPSMATAAGAEMPPAVEAEEVRAAP